MNGLAPALVAIEEIRERVRSLSSMALTPEGKEVLKEVAKAEATAILLQAMDKWDDESRLNRLVVRFGKDRIVDLVHEVVDSTVDRWLENRHG